MKLLPSSVVVPSIMSFVSEGMFTATGEFYIRCLIGESILSQQGCGVGQRGEIHAQVRTDTSELFPPSCIPIERMSSDEDHTRGRSANGRGLKFEPVP